MKKMIMILLAMNLIVHADEVQQPQSWIIRVATLEDKDALVQLRKKSQVFYNFQIQNSDEVLEKMVDRNLSSALAGQGFAIVAQDMNSKNKEIVGFLMYQRPMQKSYHHILDNNSMTIHPHFKKGMLSMYLYQHLLQIVQDNYPDILRIEADCPEIFTEKVAMYQYLGFKQEGKREKAVRLADGTLATDFLFAWINPNFDENLI